MVADVLVTVIAVVIVFEVFEHVIIPLIGVRAGRGRQPLTGPDGMVGKVVEVRRWFGREGTVLVDGELWQAESRNPLAAGDAATILAVSNLRLLVEPLARSIASDDSPGPLLSLERTCQTGCKMQDARPPAHPSQEDRRSRR